MENKYNPWAMFHSTDMGDNLEEVVETEDCKVLRMHSTADTSRDRRTGVASNRRKARIGNSGS